MSEEFDPEKVERHHEWGDHGHLVEQNAFVRASDYDKLLERYRKATPTRRPVMKHQGHPDRCHCVHCRNM